MTRDPLEHRAYADAVVERAAGQLRERLRQLTDAMRPFPPFPASMFTHGIEVDPPAGSPYGCVLLMEDGELHELRIGLNEDQVAQGGDQVATRDEQAVTLELAPADYVAFAYRAVIAAVDYLEGQADTSG